YVMNRSLLSPSCGANAMKPLNPLFCSLIPVSGFTKDKSTVCQGETVNITDTTKGSAITYKWNFGSGATPATASTKGPHAVTYTTSGTKTIKLVVIGDVGNDSVEQTVTVNNPKPDMTGITI